MKQEYQFFAFISYNSHDTAWGKKLQNKLERYRMPATLCSAHGWKRKPIRPVFFAPTDIQPGALNEELQERLRASRHLIVICSPHSARSEWVGREIAFFHSLGRTDCIHFFIVDGLPHSGNPETECLNPIVETLGLPEILAANIHEKVYRRPWLNRERAYVQLITKLLGVEFDTIWQRHRRQLRRRFVAWCVGLLAVVATLFGVWWTSRPVDVEVRLQEKSVAGANLPPLHDAVVTLILDNETKTDTLASLDAKGLFTNIPHRFIGRQVRLKVTAEDWLPVDTTLILYKHITLDMHRDPARYGNVVFCLWDTTLERGVAGAKVTIAGQTVRSDAEGMVRLFVPLKDQSETYRVKCNLPLQDDFIEMPSTAYTRLIVR